MFPRVVGVYRCRYMYRDAEGHPRIRYGTEAASTKSQLRAATELGVSQVGFWTFNSCNTGMETALLDWLNGSEDDIADGFL